MRSRPGAPPQLAQERPSAIALEVSSLLVGQPSGVAVYGRQLLSALAGGGAGLELTGVYRASRARQARRHPVPGLRLRPHWGGWRLHRRFPLLHALDTRFPRAYRGRLVATVFDVLSLLDLRRELELATDRFRGRKARQYAAIAARADGVVFLSEETRARFCERFRARGELRVIPPGVDARFSPAAASAETLAGLGLRPQGYLLAVGELCARKNLAAVVRAYQRLRCEGARLELALIGRPSFGWEGSEAQRLIADRPEGIHLLGFLPPAQLAAAYAGAVALLYLSHYEGFGLPVLEAMASGAPVVASRRGGIPEAAGSAAILVEPEDSAAAARAVGQVLPGAPERERRVGAGLAQASAFRWERCAGEVAAFYRDLLGR